MSSPPHELWPRPICSQLKLPKNPTKQAVSSWSNKFSASGFSSSIKVFFRFHEFCEFNKRLPFLYSADGRIVYQLFFPLIFPTLLSYLLLSFAQLSASNQLTAICLGNFARIEPIIFSPVHIRSLNSSHFFLRGEFS